MKKVCLLLALLAISSEANACPLGNRLYVHNHTPWPIIAMSTRPDGTDDWGDNDLHGSIIHDDEFATVSYSASNATFVDVQFTFLLNDNQGTISEAWLNTNMCLYTNLTITYSPADKANFVFDWR